MTVRCPQCSATLRVKAERVGNRSHGTCPSCRASVPLKPADDRIQVRCDQCGTMLKAPASSAGMQGRCPKCRAAIAIGVPMSQMAQAQQTRAQQKPQTPAPQANPQPRLHQDSHAHQESRQAVVPPALHTDAAQHASHAQHLATGHNAESSVSTQRISVKALGLETMAIPQHPLGETTADKAISRQTPGHTGASLLDAPSPALSAAAERIKAAAKGIGSTAAPPETEKKTETKPAPARTLSQILEQRERAHDEQFASVPKVKAFSAFQGLLSGVTAGAIVGTIWAILSSRLDAALIQTFLSPTPALAARLNISRDILAITLPVLLGGLVGLLTAWTEPARSAARPGLRFVRSAGFGLVIGLAMAALWFFDSGNPVNLSGITPAFNWVRDMMVTGILTGFLVLLFARSKA